MVPNLPSIESLRDVRLQVPLKVYSRDMKLMAEFGEMRRAPLEFAEFPPLMIHAVLAAEDDRFFEHPGVDYQGLLRAVFYLARTGEKGQGGSTITMQVARNFFLSNEKTYLRKLNEILLAFKIEGELGKEEILKLYLNKIYLGNRAYGVAAAAQVYYGLPVDKLSVAQVAMIAGLPKAPSKYNPIINPSRALKRRDYVLGRMHELGFLDDTGYRQALNTPDDARLHGLSQEVTAPYVAEMVRADLVERYGDLAYSEGFKVITSVDSRLQAAANLAHRDALLAYEERHGYRGAESHNTLLKDSGEEQWAALLTDTHEINGLFPALVLEVLDQSIMVFEPHRGILRLDGPGLMWAVSKRPADILTRGDVVRIVEDSGGGWRLAQIPAVDGSLVSLDPKDGAIRALVGGFDFYSSKFNRVTQARRQPGSNFKPFLYSAALEKGFTPASLINDAPVVFEDDGLEAAWRPENYSGEVFGPTRLREALVNSRNLVSIRLLRAMEIPYAIDYVSRFGFDKSRLPRDLSLALGSAALTPLEIVSGYAVFANGGYRVDPYVIETIEDADGTVVYRADPATVCPRCETPEAEHGEVVTDAPNTIAPRVITPQNDYLMVSMMGDVIRRGTGRRALELRRSDLAGKTGTTNDQQDAWFSGFNQDLVATTWVGFDQPKTLGDNETGGRAALPMWIDFMREGLNGLPMRPLEQPPGLVTVRIDPDTGLLASAKNPNAIFEIFRAEDVPEAGAEALQAAPPSKSGPKATANTGSAAEELF